MHGWMQKKTFQSCSFTLSYRKCRSKHTKCRYQHQYPDFGPGILTIRLLKNTVLVEPGMAYAVFEQIASGLDGLFRSPLAHFIHEGFAFVNKAG